MKIFQFFDITEPINDQTRAKPADIIDSMYWFSWFGCDKKEIPVPVAV